MLPEPNPSLAAAVVAVTGVTGASWWMNSIGGRVEEGSVDRKGVIIVELIEASKLRLPE